MIAEIGQFALILTLALALVQMVAPLVGAQRGAPSLMALARPLAVGQFLFVALAFAALTAGHVLDDFSILNVAANSNTAKPMLYKVAGVWGNHEGSILLWVTILATFGACVALFGNNLPAGLRARVLAVQAGVAVGFLLFSLLTSNPFARLDPAPLDGRGLNPLLQDPGLAFHPPFLYVGYVGFSIAFSFAIAALIEGRVDAAWGRWVRPWTLAAWCALTIGIALGSWWSYYELGWSGWWFWDPVENASFMPWLSGTALLHSAIVVEKRNALKSWTILLAIITFSLSLLGTFLVRSGVLTSVHAFATDPSRGIFILAFLWLVVGGSLALFAVRAPALKASGLFAPISREGGLVLNNLFLSIAAATVLLGTLFPLALDALTGQKVSVGPPYFNRTFVPLMTPLLVIMGIGPFLSWKRADLAGVLGRLKGAAAITGAVVLVTLLIADRASAATLLGIGLGVWLAASTLSEWAGRVRLFKSGWPARLRRLPRAAWGMSIAHLGMAVTILGITVSLSWQTEKLIILHPGDSVAVAGYDFTLDEVAPVTGPNYIAQRGTFTVRRGGKLVTTLHPEARTYQNPPMETTEAGIRPLLLKDLYAVIGDPDENGGWGVRIYVKPLISWIWAGSLLMMLGGLVSLSDRRTRMGAPARRAKTMPATVAAE